MQEHINKQIVQLEPVTTKRDKKGFRYYSANDGNTIYAEKNSKIYNVSEDSLQPIGEVPLAHRRFEFVGIIDDEDVKSLHPLYYEYKGIGRIRKQFGMSEGGQIQIGDYVKIKETYGGGSGTVQDIVKNFVVVKTKEGKKSYHISDLIAYSSASEEAYDLGDEGNEDYENDYAKGGELESKKQNLNEYLNNFPKNAESWRQATDEVKDIARMARITYLEVDEKEYEPLDFKTLKTPAEWNTLGREYITHMYNRMSDEAKKEFLDAFEHTFQNIKVGDTIRIKEGLGLGSLMNLEGEDLEVKKITRHDFASGTKKYYHVEFDGDKYEVREDFVDNERMEKGGETHDKITFSVDDEKIDEMLHNSFESQLEYVNENGDVLYKLPKRQFDRLIDMADSRGFNVDYENSEESVIIVYDNYSKGGEIPTITKKEWSKKQKDSKLKTNDGKYYIMKYDDKLGTYLQQVKVLEDGGMMADGGTITDSYEVFYYDADGEKHISKPINANSEEEAISKFENENPQLDVSYAKKIMSNGGKVSKVEELKFKIEKILDKVLPGFYKNVFVRKNYFDNGESIGIIMAASNYEINRVKGQYPQDVSLMLDVNDMDLHVQVFGGNGGNRIYLVPDKNDPKEKYLAMAGVKIPFRTPKKEEKFVLQAIEKFAENYKIALKENKDRLFYKEYVDYDTLIMADGGETKTQKTVKLTLLNKHSGNYTYKLDGTTGTAGQITFAFGKEPFQYDVKKISKSLESSEQDILDAFTIQGIKQHEYKGGFTEAIKHLDTKVVYEKKMASGGMTAGRYYKDNSGKEFRYIGESEGKLLFKDGEKIVTKSQEDFEDAPKEKKLFGIFKDGGETTFEDKVKAVQKNLLKKKKVPAIVQKDYGKTYSKEEAKESAQRIIGSQTAKWNAKNKMAQGGKTAISSLKDKIIGSKKNKPGTASSKTSAKEIELSETIITALSEKAKEYNKKHSNKVSTSTLKAVMRRGMGAFSSSHRPGMTRQGWGYARVNKFLLKKGGTKVKAAYTQDDDLLENGGELKKEMRVSDKPKFKKLMELEDRAKASMYKAKNYSRWNETTGENFRRRWYKMAAKLRGWEGEFIPMGVKSKPEWIKFTEEQGSVEDYNFGDVIA